MTPQTLIYIYDPVDGELDDLMTILDEEPSIETVRLVNASSENWERVLYIAKKVNETGRKALMEIHYENLNPQLIDASRTHDVGLIVILTIPGMNKNIKLSIENYEGHVENRNSWSFDDQI